jgi:hypothetical protein
MFSNFEFSCIQSSTCFKTIFLIHFNHTVEWDVAFSHCVFDVFKFNTIRFCESAQNSWVDFKGKKR